MKRTFTRLLLAGLCLTGLSDANAQFYKFLPGVSNYIQSDVQRDPDGLTFSYMYQDSLLTTRTVLLHTDNGGQVLWMKNAGSNYGSYANGPDTSLLIAGGRSNAGNRVALLQKTDKNGNILWTKSWAATGADVNVGNLLPGANDTNYATVNRSSFISNTYYTKSSVIAFNGSGQLLWTKYFSNATNTSDYSFSRTLRAANGDFIGVADIRGSSNGPANGMMITRISPKGAIIFSKYIDFRTVLYNQLSVNGLVETPTGNLLFGGRLMTDQISTYTNALWLGKMDAAGNLVQQRVYKGGEDVGELLHGMDYANGKIYAYVQLQAPFDSLGRALWIGELDESSLLFTAQHATAATIAFGDPYGNVRNAFCITSDGKPTVASGFYCQEAGKYLPLMMQYTPTLSSNCNAADRMRLLTDSTAAFPVADYTPAGTFSVSMAADTTRILLRDTAAFRTADLCSGCGAVAPPPAAAGTVRAGDAFRLYPNPGDGLFHLDLSRPGADVLVLNNLGAIVHRQHIDDMHAVLQLGHLVSGSYYLRIGTADGMVYVRRLLKDK